MKSKQEFLELISKYTSPHRSKIVKALEFAEKAHDGQLRSSGDPYLVHPIAVATLLECNFNNRDLTIAGLLHDTVEDCDFVQREHVYETFGDTVGFLVDAVSKNLHDYKDSTDVYHNKTHKLFVGGMQDVKVFLLKIADREDNFKSIRELNDERQIRISFETQAMFSPLRQILCFDDCSDIDVIGEKFSLFLKEYNLSSVTELIDYLCSSTFKNFNDELFQQIYQATNKVVWQVRSKESFDAIVRHKNFQDHCKVISMETDGTYFIARFSYKTGHILPRNSEVELSYFNK